jgi:hypothetical protein
MLFFYQKTNQIDKINFFLLNSFYLFFLYQSVFYSKEAFELKNLPKIKINLKLFAKIKLKQKL